MRVRFSGTPPNFFLAFLVAPFAGAVTAIFLVYIANFTWVGDRTLRFAEMMGMAVAVGVSTLIICEAFTVVLGICVVAYVHLRGHIPSLASALVIGFLVAVAVFLLVDGIDRNLFGMAAFAGMCSLPTAWSFWWLGLRGRRADD